MYHRNPFVNLMIWIFTGFGTFGARFRHENNLLRETQTQIIDSVAMREKLTLQIDQLKSQLALQTQDQKLVLQKERANWELQRQADKAQFDVEMQGERAKFSLEREQAKAREVFAVEDATKRAQLKADETMTLKKLEYEQKIKQAEIDRQTAVLAVKEEFAKKETTLHQTLHAEMYGKLNAALINMTQEGDKNTKFVHDLMLKIFDKAPALNSLDITQRNYTGLPPAKVVEVDQTVKQ